MFNFDYITKEDIKEHNPNWTETPDHPYRILIVGGSGSGKTNALLNLINHKPQIDKIYLYVKDIYEAKYQSLINKRECTCLTHYSPVLLIMPAESIRKPRFSDVFREYR